MKRIFTAFLCILGIYQVQATGFFRNLGSRAFQAVRNLQVHEPDKATRRLKIALLGTTMAGQCKLAAEGYQELKKAEKVHPFGKFMASEGSKKTSILDRRTILSPQEVFEVIEEEAVSYVQNNETLQNVLKHKYTRYVPTVIAGTFFVMNMHFMKTVCKQAMSKLSLAEKCCRKAMGLDYTNK